MKRFRRAFLDFIVVAAVCLLAVSAIRAADNKDSSQEFQKAADLTDIRSPGSPPFELDAKVNVYAGNKVATPGNYKLIWVSPSQWREELTYPGYTRVRVGGTDEYWQQRSVSYESLQITELSSAIDFASDLRDEQSPGKLKPRKQSGDTLACAAASGRPTKDYCFDPAEGVLVQEDITDGPVPYSFEYSNFLALGPRRFPGMIRVLAGGSLLADFSVEHLVGIETTFPADFSPPQGASRWLTCSNPEKPTSVDKISPAYPVQERLERQQGNVLIYALIAQDGSVHNLKVLGTPSQGLADAALAAVRQWRYKPRRCGGAPTPTEIIISVAFRLGG
jgi:TonB family protein